MASVAEAEVGAVHQCTRMHKKYVVVLPMRRCLEELGHYQPATSTSSTFSPGDLTPVITVSIVPCTFHATHQIYWTWSTNKDTTAHVSKRLFHNVALHCKETIRIETLQRIVIFTTYTDDRFDTTYSREKRRVCLSSSGGNGSPIASELTLTQWLIHRLLGNMPST